MGITIKFQVLLSLMISNLQVDIVDFNGSFLARVRDLAGANPIILVVTKVIILLDQKSIWISSIS